MKKNIWILNHYATSMLFNKGGRHYWFAKYLKREGYEPVIFSCNAKHGAFENYIDTDALWTKKMAEDINVPFVFVKSSLYKGNGKDRVLNMVRFYWNVQKAAKEYVETHAKPDVIYASSVHPMTLVAGIKLAKYFGVKCICEVRDLWPISLVAYGYLREDSLITKLLYAGERWIYKHADNIIMTWPGGYEYIQDKGWDKDIPEGKVCHISNGVDLEEFDTNKIFNNYTDTEIEAKYKNFVYAGSIRHVNNLDLLIEVAQVLHNKNNKDIRILIYGSGDERDKLIAKVQALGLNNIVFAGRVKKQQVPSLLSKAYATVLHNSSTSLDKYGQSQNKFFEYLAAGKPILMTYSVGYSICKQMHCGVEIDEQTPEKIAEGMEMLAKLNEKAYKEYCNNCIITAQRYHFGNLTKKLIRLFG